MAVRQIDPHTGDAEVVLSPREARQARPGRHVLNVLVASLILALIAWGLVSLYRPAPAETAPVKQSLVIDGTPAG